MLRFMLTSKITNITAGVSQINDQFLMRLFSRHQNLQISVKYMNFRNWVMNSKLSSKIENQKKNCTKITFASKKMCFKIRKILNLRCLQISTAFFFEEKMKSEKIFLIGRSKSKWGAIIRKIKTKWMELRKNGIWNKIKQHRNH